MVLIILLISFLGLRIALHYFQKKNSRLTKKKDQIVEGQIGYVYTAIVPGEKGYIVCESKQGVQFLEATADLELKEGTAIIVISVEENTCKVKPLVSRV
ncbi:MAG TPA: NfeD family protein [Candidatus Eisenbacteria bacterium]|nr:NfeD family protein [Candidatus Eisenbacteria bacterium]